MNKIPVLVFHDNISAYGICRALGPLGIPLYLVSKEKRDFASYSKYFRKRTIIHPFSEHFINDLVDWTIQNVGDCVVLMIAGDDDYLKVLSENTSLLPSTFLLTFPNSEITKNVLSKKSTYEAAERIGIPYPRSFIIKSGNEFREFLGNKADLAFPWLLKAEESNKFERKYGVKGILCNNIDEVIAAFDKYDGFLNKLLISEYIPGGEENLYNFIGIFNHNSLPVEFFVNKKIRSTQRFASCTLMESAWSIETVTLSFQLAKELKYYGYFNPEYKYDERDGKLKLMEVNGRITKSNSHPLKCGINILQSLYDVALNNKPDIVIIPKQNYLNKIYWWYPAGDLGSIFYQIKNNEFSFKNYVKSLRGSAGFIIEPFNLADPVPSVISLVSTIKFGFVVIIKLVYEKLKIIITQIERS